ncbi:type II secretion system F family protein [Desulfurispira natronophila]|uniref:Type II secretory pathway component PulF n=1 Tax=Desulfurispira natronophila TaxID=682562 RepID=A0A7W7Y4P7_9BACT|nr:type II secretory pathway component PulF [Desulfurispira natronophila]
MSDISTFSYEACRPTGELVEGTVRATSPENARQQLLQQGMVVLALKPQGTFVDRIIPRKGLPHKERLFFLRQISALLSCGIPLSRALVMIANSHRHTSFSQSLMGIETDLRSGSSLWQAMQRYPHWFDSLLISMVRVGEATGSLDEMFEHSARVLESRHNSRKRLANALRYPSIVLVSLVAAFAFCVAIIIPRFADIFSRSDTPLPPISQGLIAVSNFSLSAGPYLLVVLAAVILIAAFQWRRQPRFQAALERIALRVPLLGPIIQKSHTANLFMALKTMLSSGIPLREAVSLLQCTSSSALVQRQLAEVDSLLHQGSGFAAALEITDLFPSLALQLVRTGEDTGTLDIMLERTSRYYDQETEHHLQTLAGYLEPALLLVAGTMVCLLALGVLLPMWHMAGAWQ